MTSEDVRKLVRELRRGHEQYSPAPNSRLYKVHPTAKELEAATALTTLSATIEELRGERDALINGERAVLPRTKQHAENLYTVAVACLKGFGADPESQLTELREALTNIKDGYRSDGRVWLDKGNGTREAGPSLSDFIAAAIRSRTTGDVDEAR